MKISTKARRGRRRDPPGGRDHHTIGATQDPILRAQRVAYRRARLEALMPNDPRLDRIDQRPSDAGT